MTKDEARKEVEAALEAKRKKRKPQMVKVYFVPDADAEEQVFVVHDRDDDTVARWSIYTILSRKNKLEARSANRSYRQKDCSSYINCKDRYTNLRKTLASQQFWKA